MKKGNGFKSFEKMPDVEAAAWAESLFDAYGPEASGLAKKRPRTSVKLDTEEPWSHEQRKLGDLYAEASAEERERARVAYRRERIPKGKAGLIDALPAMMAKRAFEAGWLDLEDSAWAKRAERFLKPTEADLGAESGVHAFHGGPPVPTGSSKYSLFEQIVLLSLGETWWSEESTPGSIGAARLARFAVDRDGSLSASVDKVAVEFGVAAAKSADLGASQIGDLPEKIRRMRAVFETVGVSAGAMARSVAGLAVFTRCKPLRDMLAAGEADAGERPGQQAWMQALRGAVGVDDARVALMVVEAAKADGLDMLGASCRWKNASAMRSAMGLACELGSIECARAFGARGAASGVVILDGSLLDSANPLISLVDRCLAGYLHPKGGVDGKLWEEAFANIFEAIGKEIESEPLAEQMMDEMARKLESRPAEIKRIWDAGYRSVNLGAYCGKVLGAKAVGAATATLERALMMRRHPEPKVAPGGEKDKARMRL